MELSRNQLLRIRRTLLASVVSLLHLLLCWLLYAAGFMQLGLFGMLLLTGVVLASCVGMLVLTWMNLNLRFQDPSLTLQLMCMAITVVFVTAYFAQGQGFLLLSMVLMALMFGAFSLRPAGFIKVVVFIALGYAALVAARVLQDHDVALRIEVIQAITFFVLVIGMTMLGLEISGLRRTLQTRNRDLNEALERIQQLAITDELTGLYNRRFAKDLLVQQKALADRGGYSFVLCMIDLDLFKSVNDRYGHAGGDAVLDQLARVLEQAIRDVDYVARIGGEEFLLVLSQTDLEGALQVLERLRANLMTLEWQACPDLRLTLSVGVTCFRSPELTHDTLQRADSALFQAKLNGRNQVAVL